MIRHSSFHSLGRGSGPGLNSAEDTFDRDIWQNIEALLWKNIAQHATSLTLTSGLVCPSGVRVRNGAGAPSAGPGAVHRAMKDRALSCPRHLRHLPALRRGALRAPRAGG